MARVRQSESQPSQHPHQGPQQSDAAMGSGKQSRRLKLLSRQQAFAAFSSFEPSSQPQPMARAFADEKNREAAAQASPSLGRRAKAKLDVVFASIPAYQRILRGDVSKHSIEYRRLIDEANRIFSLASKAIRHDLGITHIHFASPFDTEVGQDDSGEAIPDITALLVLEVNKVQGQIALLRAAG